MAKDFSQEETRIIRDEGATGPFHRPATDENKTWIASDDAPQRKRDDGDEGKTRLFGFEPMPFPSPGPEESAGPGQSAQEERERDGRAGASRERPQGPVVGWLVVVDGPGKGHSLEIGYGHNSIGREAGQRIPLDFGDGSISRDRAAVVSYVDKGRSFHLSPGADTINIVYRNAEAVLAPVKLDNGDTITLGATTLRFVALCGEEFSWDQRTP